MSFHINYDGKVFPCRSKVKACPYGPSRHADFSTDLFYKYQEKYNNVDASPNLINQLKSGQPFTGLQDLDGEITVSSAPIELICSVLKVALENAGATSLSKRDYEFRENAINNCVLMLQARFAS